MKSRELDDGSPVRPSGQTHTSEHNDDEQSAVVGNERITALAGAVLLVLILVELVSAAILRTGLAILLFPGAAPWIVWSQTNGTIPAPMIVGLLVAILALLATRPLRWR